MSGHIHLENIHFAARDKVAHRKRVTVGVVVSTVVAIIGMHAGVPYFMEISMGINTLTATYWIWE